MVASPSHGSFGNDEDAWFGGADDRDAEARAEQSVAAVGARIIGAKPFPIAARRLEELTRNPKARLEQVVSVLETDPGLSVRLLRLVNSAGYGLKVRVTSVRHAAVLVGTRRLHQVATTAAILDLFETNNETAVELLEHATVVGSLCRYLAVHLGLPHDELFTCGFLHDIGKLMMLDTEGEKYAELVRTYGGAPDQLHTHERRVFGFDHALLGAHVLKAWNIPEPVPKVVRYHHAPQRAMQDSLLTSMVHTLRLADMMSYALVLDSDQEGITIVTESEAAQYLEISEPQVAAMWADLRALADRSRARSHGQPDMEVVAPRRLDVPRSLRPRRSGAPRSLPPSGSMPPSSSFDFGGGPKSSRSGAPGKSNSDVNEVPTHFPCVACSKPSYGNICAACEGQVCPEHQIGPDHWCVLCMGEYAKFRTKNALPGYVKVTGLAIAGFSVGASVTGVMVSQTFAVWKLIVAPLTMVLLWGVLLPVAHRWWMRKRFVDSRPKGRIPLPIKLPRPDPVFIDSLDASLKSDGMLGPSILPPSQTGISIIAPRPQAVEPSQPSPAAIAAEAKASAALLQHVHVPTESSMVAAPVVDAAPAAAQEPAAPSSAVVVAASAAKPATPSAKELDAAARAFERSSEVIPATPSVPPPESIGPLRGAATSLNPPGAAPPAAPAPLPRQTKKDTVAAHIAALLGERSESEGLSEFPSVGSESELENVVASVSARLAREFPQNDYMGPSSELRAASIAPIPERAAPVVEPKREPEPVVEAKAEPPAVEAKREPEPVVEAKPEPVVEAKPEPVVEAKPEQELVVEAKPEPEPVAEAKRGSVVATREPESVVEAESELAVEAKVEPGAAPKPEPVADDQTADFAPNSSGRAAPASIRLVFPRKNWEQGCAPRRVFRCALPVADSCSPAPRRVSVRPAAPEYAVSDTVPPGTLRGLG